jgi:hypothetical protein
MSFEEKQKETDSRGKEHGKAYAMADAVMIPIWLASKEPQDEIQVRGICGK